MKKITANDPLALSEDLPANNIRRFRELFPAAWVDGQLDVAALRQLLGDVTESGPERFGLDWNGKRAARQLALAPSGGTLRPCPDDSVDWAHTRNLVIDGDNLEVLKLLQKSHAGKVQLIFIDPPYNTGKDFIYPDNFTDGIRHYQTLTGQRGADGRLLTSNPESSGRFHTAWLNMMYPRLMLARNLLAGSGVILIAIGDEELHNLRAICDEIYGSENFCGMFVWEKKKKPSFLDRNMGTVTDYIVAYARNRESSPAFVAGAVEDGKKYPFNNAGNGLGILRFPAGSVMFGCEDRVVAAKDMSEGNIRTTLLDEVQIVDGSNANAFRLQGEWRYSQAKLDEFVAAGAEIRISKEPFRPNYVNRSGDSKKTANLLSWRVNGVPTNEDATDELRAVFGEDVMSYPKPTGLLKYLVRALTSGDDIVMDFFAGSGSTAVGVWQQNIEDLGSRRFIMVQLPEPLDPANREQAKAARYCDRLGKPRNIAELSRERLRRTGQMLKDGHATFSGDFGFRAFRLDSSNVRAWDPGAANLEQALLAHVEHIKDGRGESDVLFEVLLKHGLDLCVPIASREVAGITLRAVGGGILFAALEGRVTCANAEAIADALCRWKQELDPAGDCTVVFRDSLFADDVARANVTAALGQQGITNVRSL